MRLFQNSGVYPAYLPRLRRLSKDCTSFEALVGTFLGDRYGAAHFLLPVLNRDPSAFFTNGDDELLQRQWAQEHGMPRSATLETILLAQIEHQRTEVFYNLDPVRYGSDFVRKLPGSVKKSIAWRAAPSPGADFGAYDLIVCNFPGILESYRQRGWGAEYFSPAHDPEMDAYAANTDRPIDVLFVGGYSRHHRNRAEVLEAVADQNKDMDVVFHLDCSRLTRLAESPVGRLPPLSKHRRPRNIRAVAAEPVFGRDLYVALSRSKIVLNGAIDMAGKDRGNMRCFEAMGCGALMVSDEGRYPEGMVDGETMLTYSDPKQAARVIKTAFGTPGRVVELAANGYRVMLTRYNKEQQWHAFRELVGAA
jgi:hypothetical protein